MKTRKILSILLALALALGLAPAGASRVWADSTRAFVDQPEDVLMDEGATGRLHWSVNFIPENNDTYWLTGGDLPEGEAVKIYTMFHYEIGDELRFAENLREMYIVVEETWISDKPYRIRFRDELGTEHFSDPFYVKYAPKAFVLQPQTVFIPTDDPEAKVPITWVVNFTPDSPQLFRVFNQNLFAWVDEYFTDRAGNPAYSRKTMEVMADASMISEDDYWINFYDVEADHWAYQSAHFYIYPEGIGLLTEQPQDVFIVDGQPAPLTWSVDFTPSNWIDDWGYEEDVFLFDDGNVPSGYLYAPDDMYHYLSGMNVDVSPQQDMTLMAQPEWVSSNPYRLIISQKDCPRVYSDYFYIRAAHTVKFVPNEYGLGIPDQIVVDGECAVEPELAATREGYTFRGWYKDAAFTERYDFATPVEEALTLYAKWDINYYRVDFNTCCDVLPPAPQLVPYWDTVSEPEAPAREGGVFCGWYTDPEYNNVYDFSRHVTGPLTLYAKWDIPIYTVYFQNKGIGTKPPLQKVVYGETASRPEDPSQDGYFFGGWWIDGSEYDFAAPVKRNLTLWAKWTKQCTITFDAGGGSGAMEPATALERSEYTVPECGLEAPAGKRFKYWSVSPGSYYKTPGSTYTVSGDAVFTAVWETVATRVISFSMNGHGEQIPVMRVEYNTVPAGPPEPPTADGWTFTGWYTTEIAANRASSYYLYDFTKPLTDNITLYAGWRDDSMYKIHLSYGGTGYGSAVLTGTDVVKLDDETYMAHPGTTVSVENIVPAEGSETGEGVWGRDWIRAGTEGIGNKGWFTMPSRDIYVDVMFTMKPVEEGGHLHTFETLDHVDERPATCTVDGCMEHYECPICDQWFYVNYRGELDSVFSVEYYTERATGHVPADPVQEIIEPATCEFDGFCDMVVCCSVCGEELDREFTEIPAFGHDWSEPEYVWADDYSSVTATHICANDPSHVETEVSATSVWWYEEASCEYGEWTGYIADGFTLYGFNAQFLEVEGAPALGHAWDDGYVDTEPTCEDDGLRILTCTRCGEMFYEPIPALGHDWTDVKYTWSADHRTCTASAVCSRDPEHIASEPVNAVFALQTAATCEADGKGMWTAVFADPGFEAQTAVETIPAAGHVPGAEKVENVVAATCTAFGSFERVIRCTVCNKALSTQTEPIDPLGHTWGDWTVVTPATETSEGRESRTCSRCGEAETRSIPKLSHVHILKKTEAADPTCTEAGNDAYWTCSGCGKIFRDAEAAAETELSALIRPALGHAYTDVMTVPTCTEGGYTTHTCRRCGDAYIDSETPALGHNWGDWIEVYPATIYEKGSEKRMCGRCGLTEFRDIPKLSDPSVRLSGSASGDELAYTIENLPDGALLIAARYEDGRLTDLKIVGGAGSAGTLEMDGSGDEFALFLVDAGGKPLCPDWSN